MAPLLIAAAGAVLLLAALAVDLVVFRPGSSRYGRGVGKDTLWEGGDPELVKYLADQTKVKWLAFAGAGLELLAVIWQASGA